MILPLWNHKDAWSSNTYTITFLMLQLCGMYSCGKMRMKQHRMVATKGYQIHKSGNTHWTTWVNNTQVPATASNGIFAKIKSKFWNTMHSYYIWKTKSIILYLLFQCKGYILLAWKIWITHRRSINTLPCNSTNS